MSVGMKIAFALDGLIRSRTKGHGGDVFARKCIQEIGEGLDELSLQHLPATTEAEIEAEDDQAGVRFEHSSRGFKYYDKIVTKRDESVEISESSAAEAPHIWLRVKVTPSVHWYGGVRPGEGHAHLTLEDAELLRDQLDHLIRNHYQVV